MVDGRWMWRDGRWMVGEWGGGWNVDAASVYGYIISKQSEHRCNVRHQRGGGWEVDGRWRWMGGRWMGGVYGR